MTGRWPRERAVAPLLFVGLLAVFVVVQRGTLAAYDSQVMVAVGRAITHHRLSLTQGQDPFGRNSPYASFGIGVSLVVAPLYLLQQAVGLQTQLIVTLANPLLLAATGVAVYGCGRRLGWSRPAGVLVATAFGVLTMALQASTEQFSEPGVALGTSLVVLGLLRWRDGARAGAGLAGVGTGAAVLFRSDSLLLVVPVVSLALAVVPFDRLRRLRPLVALTVPILAAAVWTSVYSELRSGTLLPSAYGGRFTTPLHEGLRGLLLSHGKSLFVYNPLLLLAVPGALVLWRRRQRAVTVLLVVLFALRPLFYARWNFWTGDVAWGPRFLMPCTVPLVLLTGESLRAVPRLRLSLRLPAALVVAALTTAAAVVAVASVWVPYEAAFNATKRAPGLTGRAASAARYHNLVRYRETLADSSIGYNLRHLDSGPLPLHHFQGQASATGIVALGLAIAAPTAAAVLGRRRRDDADGQGDDQPTGPRRMAASNPVA